MRKQLCPIGNSVGLILDRALLELLDLPKDAEVDLRVEGKKLIISRARKPPTLKEGLEILNKRHGASLAKLAK
jgi:antitoxin MazE